MTEPKKVSPLDQLCYEISSMRDQIKKGMPPHIDVDKFIRNALTFLRMKGYSLVEAERNSVYGAFMRAAQFGLMVDGEESTIVAYKSKGSERKIAQFMPCYQGLLKLVRNSGEIASITVKVVYKGDEFDRWTDENGEHLKHREKPDGEQAEITHAYMVTQTKGGARYIEVMTLKDLEKVKRFSRSAKDTDSPWNTWQEQMAKKSVIRRGYKLLPKSTDIDQVLHADDDLFKPDEEESDPQPPAPQKTSSPRLSAALNKAKPVEESKVPAPQTEPAPVHENEGFTDPHRAELPETERPL